ncbi:tRNA (adenosine(37)-N6)-dimethylallyltransferase MiaA [Aquabacterium sp.]|uniref:tRNA (adenosine(37)-N6)-dimethylallyltransferase MiaA n=1 Tax=Aquabacterium sp. TaxID=1872578 RepID=UPI0035ADDAA6
MTDSQPSEAIPLRAIALAGPTASGKTACALAIAQALPCEIISVDSALVYKGMDIGTAKPTPAELAAVPHHLIDVIEPTESYSAARFVADANRLIDEITARGRLPLLVGGTMLYFKALFDGLDDIPSGTPELRAEIELEAAAQGWPAMHAQLAQVDAPTAARLAPNDAQRISRALEVWRISGQPLSSFHSDRFGPGKNHGPDDIALLSLEPTDRAWLHRRIAQRYEQMMAAGFVDEVRRLRARGDLHIDLPSMRCVGYRQVWEALDAHDLIAPRALPHVVERGIAATRQLAKRQITWLRSMPWRTVVDCQAADATEQVVCIVQSLRPRLSV